MLFTTWTSRLWIPEPHKFPLEWCPNSFQRTDVLNLFRKIPLEFLGIAHLFPKDLKRPLRPVRVVGLYLIRSAERAKGDPQQKLFVHFSLVTQLFTTHFRSWVAETIRLTYENLSESDLPKIRAHDVRAVAASEAYYRNTPLSELCGLIGWISSNVFVRHYLKGMAANTELQDIPLVAARTALH